MTVGEIKGFYRSFLQMYRDLAAIRSVLKTDAGRMESVGKAFIQQAVKKGHPQATVARWLEIAPAAVSYHVR